MSDGRHSAAPDKFDAVHPMAVRDGFIGVTPPWVGRRMRCGRAGFEVMSVETTDITSAIRGRLRRPIASLEPAWRLDMPMVSG
ncbi:MULTISPECIES: hypothetical protein [Catenuloplanes]|uniref:Uncharacterized protein n=1 Tax=Catenuloplanes niger TaxID=587534 RepID=A0AAE3ZXI8_9ACTN|nr:hypothetical protein [Catenuloplanes niger]MDR7327843.1 hypothetical protein [Catenuloplanes niger]